jgi:hypothetical protein
MVNDIAPEALRGQYNAGFTLAFSTGGIAGSVIAGWALGDGLVTSFCLILAGACVLSALAASLAGRRLPHQANAIPARTSAPQEETA